MAGPIRISILANASQAKKELNSVANQTQSFGSKMKSAGKVAGLALATGAAAAGAAALKLGADSVKAASDAQQSLGATETVFGKYADTVVASSKKAATQFGIDANTYRENANLLGALFSNQGVSAKKLGGATKEMIGVGADLAATFGGTTTDAVGALSAAFKGEFDSLEKYGISLKESTIQAELAARGQDKLTGAALAAAKQQVTSDLIMKQSSKTRGAFAKESNTLAHQQQVLSAQFTDLKAKLGTALLPIITKVLTVINNNFTPAIKAIGEFLSPVIARVKEFFAGLGGGSGTLSTFGTLFQTIANTVQNVILPAITSLVTYLAGMLYPVFTQVVGIIQGKVIPIFASIYTFIYGKLVPIIVTLVAKIASNLKPIFDQLVATVKSKVLPAVSKLLGKFQEWGPTIGKVITVVVKIIGKVLEFASAILGKVLPPVIRFAGFLIGKLFSAVGTVIGIIVKIIAKVIAFGGALIDGGRKVGEFANKVDQKIRDVIQWFKELPDKIKNKLSDAGTMLTEIGKDIIRGLVDGLDEAKQWAIDKIQEIADKIPNWVKKRLGIASPSKVMKQLGVFVSQGLAEGIEEGGAAVDTSMENISSRVAEFFNKKFPKAKGKAKNATKAFMKSLKDEAAALRANLSAQKANNAALEEARKNLEDAIKVRDDYAASVSNSVLSTGNITGFIEEGTVHTAQTVIDGLRTKMKDAQEFATLIGTLTARGLNQTNLDQLIQAGVDGGLATARALADGGPQAIAEINSLTGQLQAVATSLGTSTAATMHDSGVQAAQGLVDGFESMADKLEAAGNRLAKKLVKAIKKALKIKSPSRVFKELGHLTTKGLELGLRDTTGVERATYNLGRVMQSSFHEPRLRADASIGSRAAGGDTININVNAPATVDKAALGREITSAIDSYYKSGGRRLAL